MEDFVIHDVILSRYFSQLNVLMLLIPFRNPLIIIVLIHV